jgi:hypothetical protein
MPEKTPSAPCLMCGFSHRYQWPSGSDADGHDGSYVACINMLRPALDEARKAWDDWADHALRRYGCDWGYDPSIRPDFGTPSG